jgi:phage-related protein
MLGRGPLAFGPLAALTGLAGGGTATLSATLDPLISAGIGKVAVKGTFGTTLGAMLLAGAGKVPGQGTLAATLGGLGFVATGSVPSRGTLAATLGAVTLTATGSIPARGTLGTTLGALVLAGASDVLVQGRFAPELTFGSLLGHGPIASAPLASLRVSPVPLDAVVLAGTGTVGNQTFTGTLNATLADLLLTGTGRELVQGTLAATLGPATLNGIGLVTAPRSATLAATLGPLTLQSFGFIGYVPDVGVASITLGPLVLAGAGRVALKGTLGTTLGPVTLAGAGHVPLLPRTGTLHVTLGPAVLAAAGFGTSSPINLPAWPHEWCAALGPSRTNTLTVNTVQFSDGYAHRSTRGLNPVQSTMAYVFPFADLDQLTAMNAFLRTYGAQGFAFLPPDKLNTVAVCASEWSATIIDRTGQDNEVVGALQVTLARMFNPQPLQLPL